MFLLEIFMVTIVQAILKFCIVVLFSPLFKGAVGIFSFLVLADCLLLCCQIWNLHNHLSDQYSFQYWEFLSACEDVLTLENWACSAWTETTFITVGWALFLSYVTLKSSPKVFRDGGHEFQGDVTSKCGVPSPWICGIWQWMFELLVTVINYKVTFAIMFWDVLSIISHWIWPNFLPLSGLGVVMKNPSNLAKHQGNPKVAPVISKMFTKFAGAGAP
jgi:hypothetical protein